MIKVGVVGGTGYTGVELLRLLAQHPEVELARSHRARKPACRSRNVSRICAARVDLAFSDPREAPLSDCDVVFFATPNGVAMSRRARCSIAGARVIDFAADFRIKDVRDVGDVVQDEARVPRARRGSACTACRR